MVGYGKWPQFDGSHGPEGKLWINRALLCLEGVGDRRGGVDGRVDLHAAENHALIQRTMPGLNHALICSSIWVVYYDPL